ncbi:MAG: hypothetical protein PHE51_09595 [Eubacteriales bacterium]|nr:hypothetical protein [Eubacteriales bacterium]
MNKPQWIWSYGDFELYQHIKMSLQREARGGFELPCWKLYPPYPVAVLGKDVEVEKDEEVFATVDGVGQWRIDGCRYGLERPVTLTKGHHFVEIIVGNQHGVPAVFIEGETVISDTTWRSYDMGCNYQMPTGSFEMYDKNLKPSDYELPCTPIKAESIQEIDTGIIVDFGKETFIKFVLEGFNVGTELKICYGESIEESNDYDHAPIRETITVDIDNMIRPARACRYVRIDGEISGTVSALYEYLPLTMRGKFTCDDELINKIYDVSEYTLRLNSRMFLQDGIKRDRWVWSGDAYQSYFADYYSYFDFPLVERTMIALRGGDPIFKHINTIVDYSFYWIIAFKNHYLYTGDLRVIKNNYDNIISLMQFCISRANEDGLIEGLFGDWVFIDWADMEKDGALCAMQMLYCKALEATAYFGELLGDASATKYADLAKDVKGKIYSYYWNKEKGAFVTTYKDGKPSQQIRRHANLFAIIFDFADEETIKSIVTNVIENDDVPQITTPYFKYYELEALCMVGNTKEVMKRLRSYWGGMLDLGATTFWEEYDPTLSGAEHYAMYGQPYDKSLCHAWGASPIYILGRYCLGVYPTSPAYKTFEVKPDTFGLNNISGSVPTPDGDIAIEIEDGIANVLTTLSGGTFIKPNGERCRVQPNVVNRFEM